MGDWKLSPEEVLEDLINKNVKLQIVEYLSAALAIAGTVATAVTSQAVYAAAPLTLSVVLNLFNRRQLDQLTRQHTFADTTEIQRRLAADIQALRTQVHDLPMATEQRNLDEIQEKVAALSEKIVGLEPQMQSLAIAPNTDVPASLEHELAQLREQQQGFAESLAAMNLTSSVSVAPDTYSSGLVQDVAALKATIAQLEQRSGDGEATVTNLEPLRAELQAMWAPIRRQISDYATELEMLPAQTEQIGQMQAQVVGFNSRLDEALAQLSEVSEVHGIAASTQDELQRVQNQLDDMQQRLSQSASTDQLDGMHQELNTTLMPLQNHLSVLQTQLDNMPVFDSSISQAQSEQLQAVQNQLEGFSVRIDQVSGQFSTIDEVRTAISPLQDQVLALQSQLNSLPTFDPVVSQSQSEQLHSVQSQLEAVGTRIDQIYSGQLSTTEEVHASITPLQEKLATLQSQLENQPMFDPAVTQAQSQQLQTLQHELAELGTRMDHLTTNVSTELAKIPNLVDEKVHNQIQPQYQPVSEERQVADSKADLDAILANL